MLAAIKAASTAIKLGLGAVLGALIGWAVTFAYVDFITIPAAQRSAMESTTRTVNADWERKLAAAKVKAEDDAKKAQDEIDAVEREYYERDKARQNAMAALEKALEEEQANVPTPSPAVRGAPSVCRPTISRGVRDALQRIGRSPAGADSAKPNPAVRRSR